jgi:hypothetical protein
MTLTLTLPAIVTTVGAVVHAFGPKRVQELGKYAFAIGLYFLLGSVRH